MTESLLTTLKWFNQIAAVFLLQSTVVLLLGLTIAKIAKRHGSLIQAAIFRATFIGVCASPILAIALSWLGVSGFALNLPIGTEISEFVPGSIQSNNSGDWINGNAITESIPFDSTVRREPYDLPASTAAGQSVADGPAMYPIPSDSQLKTVANSTVRSNSSWNSLVLYVVPTIWLVGSFFLLAKLLLELRCVRKLCNSSVAVTESVKKRVEKLSAALRIKVPKVAFHDLIASPCVTGFWSPLVLLPIDVQDPAAQEKSMIHELAHLSRGDVKWNFVQRIALAVLFPQPLLWRLVYRMEAVAEDVCDDFVVKYTHDRTGYAQQLVDLAESQQVLPNIAGLGMFSSSRSVLYSRVERILDASRQLSIRLNRQSIVLVFIVLVALSAVGSFFRHQTSIGPSITSDKLQSVPEPENETGSVFQEGDDKQSPEQIEVRGVVRDAKGKPAPNVELFVDWLQGEKKVQSDSKGEYWVLVPKGTDYLQVRAFAEGRLSQGIFMQHQSLTQDVEIPIDLAPVRIINVRIIDNAGAAVEGATVTAINSEKGVVHRRRRMDTSVSDAQGNASLLVPIQMPIENVVAVKPGQGIDYQPARFGDKLAFPTEKPVTFPPTPFVLKLTGIQPVSVTVQSDYGTPLPNAKVKISSIAPKPDNPPALDSDAIGDFDFVTNEKGNVELNVLPDWCIKAHLRAEIAGYATHHNEEYNPKFHGGKITIQASKLVPVCGTVFDENNLPVPGLKLEFDAQGSRIGRNTGFHHRNSATTDVYGKFWVELPEDTGCLAMSATNRIALKNAEPFVIEAGKPVPDQVYRTCQATRIFGRVTAGPDRKPVSACDVLFLRIAEVDNVPIPNAKNANYRATLNRQIDTVSQSDGRFEIFAAPGDYLVLRPVERIGEQVFSLNDEREFECNIHLEKFGKTTLKGQIVCNDPGVSLQGLRVHWQYMEQVSEFADRDTQSAKDGSFEFERASHRILAYIETPDRRHGGFVVMEPDDNEAKITLRPTVAASGIVIDAQSGNPLANSEFQICHQIRYGQITTSINFPRTIMTDANGQFQATGLAVGLKYTIQRVFRGNRHPNDMSWRDVHEFTPDETEQIDLGVIRVPENSKQLSDGEMLDQRIDQIFEDKKPVADRLKRALEIANYSNQHVAILIGDPRSKPIRDLIESTMQNRELLGVLPDFVLRGVSLPMNEETRATLAKANVIIASEDASPISLFVIDSEGQLLDQFTDRDLLLDGEFKPNGLISVLQKHSLKPIDAKDALETALAKAKQENKRLIVQQTATWCAPCFTLSQYFENTRSIWEKDYVWVKIDNRWNGADELMKEHRKNGSSGGIPWFAILDADGKTLVTSDDANGKNVGYPSDEKSKSHFRKMIQTTATRLTESEIDLLMSGFEDK